MTIKVGAEGGLLSRNHRSRPMLPSFMTRWNRGRPTTITHGCNRCATEIFLPMVADHPTGSSPRPRHDSGRFLGPCRRIGEAPRPTGRRGPLRGAAVPRNHDMNEGGGGARPLRSGTEKKRLPPGSETGPFSTRLLGSCAAPLGRIAPENIGRCAAQGRGRGDRSPIISLENRVEPPQFDRLLQLRQPDGRSFGLRVRCRRKHSAFRGAGIDSTRPPACLQWRGIREAGQKNR